MTTIKNWFITGDTHGYFSNSLELLKLTKYKPEETALIVLGDCGLNFYLNQTDKRIKRLVSNYGYTIYCLRGNHEERPENISTMKLVYDENVKGKTYTEEEFPLIRYFIDGGIYEINNHKVLTIGGAYSVDKWYRLARAGLTEKTNNPHKSGWFSSELLTPEEMDYIGRNVASYRFDFVFTHTCPLSWQPTDLFLEFIDQETVDKSMETWLDSIKSTFDWGVWCFGHFHWDRAERPHVLQLHKCVLNIEDIWDNRHHLNFPRSPDYNK